MRIDCGSFITITILIVIGVAGPFARAEDQRSHATRPLAEGETGVLVLNDGGVLTGQIARAADWYIVSRDGGQMQIAQRRVMLACRTMAEAYEFRRRQITGTKVEPHLSLADWCLRYNLLREARDELDAARRLDPDHLRLAVLERRLEKAGARLPPAAIAAANAALQPQDSTPAHQQAAVPENLPDGALELFTRKVQPVLVNNCTTAGCHQSGGLQSFQLDRAIVRGESSRRSTMYNLQAALKLVDRENPAESPLLTIPRERHHGLSAPILGPRQEPAFQHLVDWVALVAQRPDAVDEEAKAHGELATQSMRDDNKPQPPTSPIRPVNQLEAVPELQSEQRSDRKPPEADYDEPANTLKRPHRLQFGARLAPRRPRDPFDPEIFNRLPPAPMKTASAIADPANATQQR
jgi:hypothetical protein